MLGDKEHERDSSPSIERPPSRKKQLPGIRPMPIPAGSSAMLERNAAEYVREGEFALTHVLAHKVSLPYYFVTFGIGSCTVMGGSFSKLEVKAEGGDQTVWLAADRLGKVVPVTEDFEVEQPLGFFLAHFTLQDLYDASRTRFLRALRDQPNWIRKLLTITFGRDQVYVPGETLFLRSSSALGKLGKCKQKANPPPLRLDALEAWYLEFQVCLSRRAISFGALALSVGSALEALGNAANEFVLDTLKDSRDLVYRVEIDTIVRGGGQFTFALGAAEFQIAVAWLRDPTTIFHVPMSPLEGGVSRRAEIRFNVVYESLAGEGEVFVVGHGTPQNSLGKRGDLANVWTLNYSQGPEAHEVKRLCEELDRRSSWNEKFDYYA